MKFDKSRVYTAANADELHAGDTVILADNIAALRSRVEGDKRSEKLREIVSEDCGARFLSNDDFHYGFAYLVGRVPEFKYIPWESGTCPLKCGDVITDKDGSNYLILAVQELGDWICIFGRFLHPYDLLDEGWTYGGGKPCGQKVEKVYV